MELAGGIIVEEEKGFCALYHEVVDRHRHEIDPHRVVDVCLDCDFELGADAVVGGDEHRIPETASGEIEQPAKAAERSVGPYALR